MVKKFLLLGLVWFSFAFTTATAPSSTNSLKWQNWNEGFVKANQEQKIALIDVYTDWCGWCKRMDKSTYENQAVISKINEHFVPIKFNPEKSGRYIVGKDTFSGRQLEMALSQNKRSGYPTTFFYLPTKNAMIQRAGYMDAKSFGKLLDEMIAKAQ